MHHNHSAKGDFKSSESPVSDCSSNNRASKRRAIARYSGSDAKSTSSSGSRSEWYNLNRLICYPKGATVSDGREAFVAWVNKHQGDKQLMEELPVIGLVRALADRYPCKA